MRTLSKMIFMAIRFVISVLASARTEVYACGVAGVDSSPLAQKNAFSKRFSS